MKKIKTLLVALVMLFAVFASVSCTEPAPPRGTMWKYGTEVPTDSSTANIGDFYMKTDTNEVYVLEEDGWILLTSLNGRDGKDGVDGANGTDWLYGSKAPTDLDGADGNFWLDTSMLQLYKKASGKWELIATLK